MAADAQKVRRMPRAQRREQILDAATRAFARAGYVATSLDGVTAEAGVTLVLLYRHFASKADLYRAVLDRACNRLETTVGSGDYDDGSIPALLRAAAEDPDGFRLLFRHAAREPEFCDVVDGMRAMSAEVTRRELGAIMSDGPWLDWAVQLVPTVTLEAVIAWLDAGQPEPGRAAERIAMTVHSVIQAARGID